jgi:hypothetical protein
LFDNAIGFSAYTRAYYAGGLMEYAQKEIGAKLSVLLATNDGG